MRNPTNQKRLFFRYTTHGSMPSGLSGFNEKTMLVIKK